MRVLYAYFIFKSYVHILTYYILSYAYDRALLVVWSLFCLPYGDNIVVLIMAKNNRQHTKSRAKWVGLGRVKKLDPRPTLN